MAVKTRINYEVKVIRYHLNESIDLFFEEEKGYMLKKKLSSCCKRILEIGPRCHF